MKTKRTILSFAVLGSVLPAIASADPVQVQDLGEMSNVGRGALVTLSGGLTFADGSTSQTVWAGTRSVLIDGALFHTYNLELTGDFGSGQFNQITAVEALGALKADALNSLFSGHDNGTFTNREQAVAFQAMIWEIVYDFDGSPESLDRGAGNVQVSLVKSSLFELMKLSAMRGGSPGMLGVVSSDDHNDLLRVVPLPSTAALAGLGLAGVVSARRRRS